MSIRRFKQQRWAVMKFFVSLPRMVQMTRSRKRYRKWYRQYLRSGTNDFKNLEPINTVAGPFS